MTEPSVNGAGASVDHDRLLAALFPAGIPAREEVIGEVTKWLAHADRLAQLAN